MKVDAYRNIQPGTVYKGLKPVPADVVQANYNGLYIPAGLVRGSVATPVSHYFTLLVFPRKLFCSHCRQGWKFFSIPLFRPII